MSSRKDADEHERFQVIMPAPVTSGVGSSPRDTIGDYEGEMNDLVAGFRQGFKNEKRVKSAREPLRLVETIKCSPF